MLVSAESGVCCGGSWAPRARQSRQSSVTQIDGTSLAFAFQALLKLAVFGAQGHRRGAFDPAHKCFSKLDSALLQERRPLNAWQCATP